MNKCAVWLCLASAGTLGCRNVLPGLRTEAHFAPPTQAAMATFPTQAPPVSSEPASRGETPTKGSAKATDVERRHIPTRATPNESTPSPATSRKPRQALAVARVSGANALDVAKAVVGNVVRPLVGPLAEAQNAVFRSIIAIPLAATMPAKQAPQEDSPAHQPVQALDAEHLAQQEAFTKLWYTLVSIGGALFTYILAPLIVDFIKLHLPWGRRQPDRGEVTQPKEEAEHTTRKGTPGRSS